MNPGQSHDFGYFFGAEQAIMTVWNLAIECSGQSGSVTLSADDGQHQEYSLPESAGSVQFLASSLRGALADASLARPDFISVTTGPGSFTGLRVGLTTAKMLAWAWDIPIAAVDPLEAIALGMLDRRQEDRLLPVTLLPVINAFRKQVFSGVWLGNATGLQRLSPTQVVDVGSFATDPLVALGLTNDAPKATPCCAGGPGVVQVQSVVAAGVQCDPADCVSPTASQVARLGWLAWRQDQCTSAAQLMPNYIRASAAEEVANKKVS